MLAPTTGRWRGELFTNYYLLGSMTQENGESMLLSCGWCDGSASLLPWVIGRLTDWTVACPSLRVHAYRLLRILVRTWGDWLYWPPGCCCYARFICPFCCLRPQNSPTEDPWPALDLGRTGTQSLTLLIKKFQR